jgi:hypothetical protein
VVAGSSRPDLREGEGCLGDGDDDPVSATFGQVYGNPALYYVLWNDQFYEDPEVQGCGESCSGPWGHSKGMLAWNDAGEGFVMQVTTPSWPASGSALHPRPSDGNTLACIDDNNVQVSQHFFALRLKKGDLEKVLDALQNASVVTLVDNPQVVHNGGPADIQERVKALGHKSASKDATLVSLSVKGVRLLSKPSKLNVPPWQLVSAKLGSTPLKAATWRMGSRGIPSTTATTPIECWDPALGHPGAVVNATTGQWDDTMFGLRGGLGNGNHAKFGVSLDPKRPYAIFGDLNQEGKLAGKCRSSQNGRGGTFFVVENRRLFQSLTNLLDGEVEPP